MVDAADLKSAAPQGACGFESHPRHQHRNTRAVMFHGYVLQSVADGHFYVGITNDLQRRLREHNKGRQRSTRARRPFRIVYSEGCASR